MKSKIVVLVMVLALMVLVLGGCCANPKDATMPKSFFNCFGVGAAAVQGAVVAAQDKVCNAPANVVTIADIVIGLLKPEIAILVPGSAPFIALVTAQAIKDTGCAVLTDLNTMITFIQGMNTKSMIMAKGMKAAPKLIDVAPLLSWEAGK